MTTPAPLESIDIATIQRNAREIVRISLFRMPDHRWRMSLRRCYQKEDGTVAAGRGVITVPVECAPELAIAVDAALEAARDRGLLP
jgi:hypothetical protein